MAIKKSIQNNKGIPADVWKIHSFNWEESGASTVALYGWNEAQELTSEPIDTRVLQFSFPTLLPYGSQVYDKICESRPVLVTPEIPEVPAVLDEEGNEVTPAIPAVPAVYEETNEFAGGLKI